jgi:hypothetical protein
VLIALAGNRTKRNGGATMLRTPSMQLRIIGTTTIDREE